MFEEMLVITLLIAIFFVVFYIIYNNKCGCNKNLIENFEDDSASNDYAFYSKDLYLKIQDIENRLDERIKHFEIGFNEYEKDIENRLDKKIQDIENRLDKSTGNSIDNGLLQKINETIKDVSFLKRYHPSLFYLMETKPDETKKPIKTT